MSLQEQKMGISTISADNFINLTLNKPLPLDVAVFFCLDRTREDSQFLPRVSWGLKKSQRKKAIWRWIHGLSYGKVENSQL